VNVISSIHFCYATIFSRTIEPTASNLEYGTVPVIFHMEMRKESILPHADTQSTLCYTSIVHLRQSQSQWNSWKI